MHNAAFEAAGLPFAYVAHDVLPERLPAAIAGVRALGYRGLSVTIPHKVAAMACVDAVDDIAQAIGCINTVVHDDGVLRGYNSDGRGALGALRAAGLDPQGKQVVVLGSGGAARAVSMTLAMEAAPARMTILGVVPAELEKLVGDVRERSRGEVLGAPMDERGLRDALSCAELLLHCTPVGMHPNIQASAVPAQLLRPEIAVFDAVYNPRQTRLLADAAARGSRIVPGLEMFLGQAVVQFELWTGVKAPVEVMRRVLEENL